MKDKTVQKTSNPGKGEHNTSDKQAEATRQKALIVNIENARISQIMEKAHVLDEKSNNTLDINSLMTAFASYLEAIGEKNAIVGTPVSFSVKRLTKGDIIRLLVRQFNSEKEKPAQADRDKKPE